MAARRVIEGEQADMSFAAMAVKREGTRTSSPPEANEAIVRRININKTRKIYKINEKTKIIKETRNE